MTAREFAKLVKQARVRSDGKWWDGRCAAHQDERASLSFTDGDRGLVVSCHAGCTVDAIARSLGLTVAQLFHANGNGHPPARRRAPEPEAVYDYHDAGGALVMQVVRF